MTVRELIAILEAVPDINLPVYIGRWSGMEHKPRLLRPDDIYEHIIYTKGEDPNKVSFLGLGKD